MSSAPDPMSSVSKGDLTAPQSTSSEPPQCFLCRGQQLRVVDSFPTNELRKAWAALGITFSDRSWNVLNGLPTVDLAECAGCGFRFCDPRLAGDGPFYSELERQRNSYYPADVPEFSRTLAWARQLRLRTVLDVGCGDGAFLDQAHAAGLGTAGVELNLQAAEACRRKGHQVETRPLAELNTLGGKFDLVTLFQVVEHVPDPVGFVSEAVQLVRSGGYISVAVPNDRGIYRICPREPHEWPPHHISRWRLSDLDRLGTLCGLKVIHSGANRLLGLEARHFWNLHNQIAVALGRRPYPGGRQLPRVLGFLYRALGLRFIVRGVGTSVYAFYQRP